VSEVPRDDGFEADLPRRFDEGSQEVRTVRWSDAAAIEGGSILIKHFPALKHDRPLAMELAEAIASAMVLEDDGKKLIHQVYEGDEQVSDPQE